MTAPASGPGGEANAALTFSAAGARRGALAVLPLLPGALAFGLVYGFLAAERGLSVVEVGLTSALVFAGASQFLALELWAEPLPYAALILGVLVVNLRHLLMAPVLLPWLERMRGPFPWLSVGLMTDESWGISVADARRGGRDAAFLLGAGATLWLTWVPASMAGVALGDASWLIRGYGLEFITTAFFAALIAGFWRGRADLVPWLVAATVALASKALLPGTWYVVVGALAGSLVGAFLALRRPA